MMEMGMNIFAATFLLALLSSGAFAADSKPKASEVCPFGKHWVQAHHRNAYSRADGTHVSAADVSAHCQDNPPSYAKWKDRLKSSVVLPAWAKNEKAKKWTEEERERVIEAISELPPSILIESVKSIYRSGKSSQHEKNPAAGDSGFIILYDRAFGSGNNLPRIIAHEFSHEVFRQIPNDLRRKYADEAGWIREGDGKSYLPGRLDYVEEDGRSSVTEDFANNIEFFIFERKKLKETAPKVDAWIQKMFGDKLGMGKTSK